MPISPVPGAQVVKAPERRETPAMALQRSVWADSNPGGEHLF